MRLPSSILFWAIVTFPQLMTSNMASASELTYEVKMDGISINGSKILNSLEYAEHAKLTVSCIYSYLKPFSCATKEVERWTIGFYVDGKKMHSQKGIWPAKSSAIGVKNGQPSCLAKFMTTFKWKAVVGPHVLRCVLNENHKIKGDIIGNNRLDKNVMIRPLKLNKNTSHSSKINKLTVEKEAMTGHSQLVIKSGSKKKQ